MSDSVTVTQTGSSIAVAVTLGAGTVQAVSVSGGTIPTSASTTTVYPTGPAGPGLPVGGTTGQMIAKASGTNYDTEWVDAPSGGGGGASEAYVDAGDAATLASAQSYADTAESDAVATAAADATSKANTAQSTAQAFATAADTTLQGTLETYADQAEADAISTASADATSKANAAQAAAEATAAADATAKDSALQTTLEAYADQAEADAISTAAADATSKANAALASAQSYADTAEADAIATAASDATSKANAALASAQSYADTAEADAIATAAADATAKADAAQAAAEATASADATAKGVPTGGTTNQVLAKASGTDRDLVWADPATGGGGGANLSIAAQTATTLDIASDTGTDATIPAAIATTAAGLLTGADKAKLDGIETGATADQTGAEIKSAYEAESDTNAFTDSEKSKLAAIEASATADQTGAEIKAAYEAEANTNAFTDAEQSKLAAIEANATADQTATEVPIADSGALITATDVEGALAENRTAINLNTAKISYPSEDSSKLAGIEAGATADQTGAEIKAAYEAEANTNAYTDSERTKLAGIEASATADQTGAEIKAAYEGESDTNAFTDSEKSKLAAIEPGATADQTAAEVSIADAGGLITATDVEGALAENRTAINANTNADKYDANGTLTAPRTVDQNGHTFTFITDAAGNEGIFFIPAGGILNTGTLFGLAGNQRGIFSGLDEVDFTSAEPASPSNNILYLHSGSTGTGSITTGTTFTTKYVYRWNGAKWEGITPRAGDVWFNTTDGEKKEFDGTNWSLPEMTMVRSATAPSDTDALWWHTTDKFLYHYDATHGWCGPEDSLHLGYPATRSIGAGKEDMRAAGGVPTRPYDPSGHIMDCKAKIYGARGKSKGTATGWKYILSVWDKSTTTAWEGSGASDTVTPAGTINNWEILTWSKEVDVGDCVGIRMDGSAVPSTTTLVYPEVSVLYRRIPS